MGEILPMATRVQLFLLCLSFIGCITSGIFIWDRANQDYDQCEYQIHNKQVSLMVDVLVRVISTPLTFVYMLKGPYTSCRFSFPENQPIGSNITMCFYGEMCAPCDGYYSACESVLRLISFGLMLISVFILMSIIPTREQRNRRNINTLRTNLLSRPEIEMGRI